MARLKQRCPGCGKLTWHTFDVQPGGFLYHCNRCGKVHREAGFRRADGRDRPRPWDIAGD